MPKIFYQILFLILFLSNISNAQQTHFKVSFDPDYAPFSYLQDNKPEGLLIDYWKLWADKNDYTIDFINGKLWDDAINLVQQEKVDFFLGTDPYEDWMKSSLAFYSTNTSLFILKNNSKGFTKDTPYIIGIVGSDYEENIKTNFPNSEVLIYENYSNIFKDFLSKKIDLIYDDKIAVEFYSLKNNHYHQIRPIELLNEISPVRAISKDEELVEIFNKGFGKLTKKELADIESIWFINENQRIYKDDKIVLTKGEKEFIKNTLLRVSVSESWKPFTFKSLDNQATGISSEFWELFSEKTGLKSEYTFYKSFTEQLSSIKNKREDVIFSTGKTKERDKYSIFTKPYVTFPISIVTLKDENFIESIDYLQNKKIAVGKNFTAHKLLKENYPNLDLILVDSIQKGLRSVSNKKVFAYIDIKPNLTYNINKLGLKDLKVSGNTGLNFELSIMIRDDYPLLQSILNKSISSLQKSEIQSIVEKWNNVQFEDKFDYTKLWIILIFISIIFLLLIYINQLSIKKNKNLQNIVNERTKELKTLNKELSQRVEIKTKELRRSNYLLDEAQKIAKLGSFTYHVLKNEILLSKELYKIFGLYQNEITPSIDKLLSFVHKDDRKIVKKEFFKLKKSDKSRSFEFRIILKNKSIKYIQATSKVTKFNKDNKAIFIIGTILDLTKIKELEIQKSQQASILAQQSKMAAMGEMLENIAHQWRQPLSVISTASTGMQFQLEMGVDVSKEFIIESSKSINEHTQYLSKTIDDFRNFFNPNKEKEFFDIKNTIEKSLSLIITRVNKNSINIIKDLESVEIESFENELIQIFLNLFNNALDAFETKKLESKFLFISTYKKDNTLYIKIKDNAGGIPRKIINRVFEPYFTTKHRAKGTGIGLYMSNEIVTKHLYGEIKVSNNLYKYEKINCKGALFSIAIPIEKTI